MKKETIRTIATLSLLVAAVTSSALAQLRPQVRATIPFNFNVGNQAMPAGKYTVERPGSTSAVVLIRAENGKGAAFLLSSSRTGKNSAEKTKLVFRRYGDQYFIGQMSAKGEINGLTFPVTAAERKVIKSAHDRHLAMASEPEEITVVLD